MAADDKNTRPKSNMTIPFYPAIDWSVGLVPPQGLRWCAVAAAAKAVHCDHAGLKVANLNPCARRLAADYERGTFHQAALGERGLS